MRDFYTVAQAAMYLGIAEDDVQQAIRYKELPYWSLSTGNGLLLGIADLVQFRSERRHNPPIVPACAGYEEQQPS